MFTVCLIVFSSGCFKVYRSTPPIIPPETHLQTAPHRGEREPRQPAHTSHHFQGLRGALMTMCWFYRRLYRKRSQACLGLIAWRQVCRVGRGASGEAKHRQIKQIKERKSTKVNVRGKAANQGGTFDNWHTFGNDSAVTM